MSKGIFVITFVSKDIAANIHYTVVLRPPSALFSCLVHLFVCCICMFVVTIDDEAVDDVDDAVMQTVKG